MKLHRVFLLTIGLLAAISGGVAQAAFVPVGAPFTINNGSAPGGALTVGGVQFSNFQVVITGSVPMMPSSIIVQAGTDGSQYGLQLSPQNFLVLPNQFLNASLSFEIRSLPPTFAALINGAEMTLTGVSKIGTGIVTIGESLRPNTSSPPVGNLSVFAGQNIPVQFMHDEVSFAPQSTLYVRKDILLSGGSPGPNQFGAAHLSEFFQLYDSTVNPIPEPSTTGLAIVGTLGLGWAVRRRTKATTAV